MPALSLPSAKRLSDLKASILNPAQTSHFQCWFNPPSRVQTWIQARMSNGMGNGYTGNEEFFSVSCSEAQLPGTSLATHTLDNDHTGITERHAYRKQYDTTSSFTFYVDHNYNIVYFFQNWINYIVNENITNTAIASPQYNYRVAFPQTYQTSMYINKFERDYYGRVLQYMFINAYPISIDTMEVSYNASQLLKCVVNFNFSRYVLSGVTNIQMGTTGNTTVNHADGTTTTTNAVGQVVTNP